jgi:two-component system response regulator (stage 0 sporulation protein F)
MVKILLVDDDFSFLSSLMVSAEKEGWQAEAATNGVRALFFLKTFNPDIIVADFQMPEMRGDQLTLAVKEKYPDIPVILMTAGVFPKNHLADRVIEKPFKFTQLKNLVEELLQK